MTETFCEEKKPFVVGNICCGRKWFVVEPFWEEKFLQCKGVPHKNVPRTTRPHLYLVVSVDELLQLLEFNFTQFTPLAVHALERKGAASS